jgi:hypothetical protein
MDNGELIRTVRESLSTRRLLVTLGVAGTMGVTEWIVVGHPVGLVFALGMGLATVTLAPLPWLWILPWGIRRPAWEMALRAGGVLACSTLAVAAGFFLYIAGSHGLARGVDPALPGAHSFLANWTSMITSIPLFAAAGWGLSRHMQLERRLELHDAREVALRNALEEARMLALRSRLDPHFLFNTLNLVAELCREDPAEAERCIVRLSGLLRAALDRADQPLVPLHRELELCADYLELCQVRFGSRMQMVVDQDPRCADLPIPPLTIQVLCENAVRHGIEASTHPGTVEVSAQAERDGGARIIVSSPGAFRGERKGGIGLQLTRKRLALAFGSRARLDVGSADDGTRTRAVLTIPGGVTK